MDNGIEKFSKIIVILWIIIYVFSSPIQYVFYKINLESLIIYLKLFIPLILIILGAIFSLKSYKICKKFLGIILLIIIGLIISFINKLPFIQIAYGLKTFLPFFAFYYYIKYISKNINGFKTIFRVLIPIVTFGLILDKYLTFPWEGISYEVGNFSYQISREWDTFGIARLSGFQRASYDSGTIICLLLVANSIYNTMCRKKNTVLDNFLCFIGIYGIYLTTFKTAYLFILIFVLYSLFVHIHRLVIKNQKIIVECWIKVYVFIAFLYSIIPPIISQFGVNINSINENNFLRAFLFKSYTIRINTTWKEAINLLDLAKFHEVLGRGIGGIGTAQQYAEPFLYNAGDNFFIYLFVTLGLISMLLIIGLIKVIIAVKLNSAGYIMFCILFIIFCFGATSDLIDSPLLMGVLGLLLALYYVNLEKKDNIE